jgi:ribosome-binding protein aMBF1 (putative translation factor)
MARAGLGWGVRELAAKAKISAETVVRFEAGERLREATLAKLKSAIERAGVEFIAENGGGAGVRLAKPAKRKRGK